MAYYYYQSQPGGYAPVDPFKPSLAYSLNNILPSRDRNDQAADNSTHLPHIYTPLNWTDAPRSRRVSIGNPWPDAPRPRRVSIGNPWSGAYPGYSNPYTSTNASPYPMHYSRAGYGYPGPFPGYGAAIPPFEHPTERDSPLPTVGPALPARSELNESVPPEDGEDKVDPRDNDGAKEMRRIDKERTGYGYSHPIPPNYGAGTPPFEQTSGRDSWLPMGPPILSPTPLVELPEDDDRNMDHNDQDRVKEMGRMEKDRARAEKELARAQREYEKDWEKREQRERRMYREAERMARAEMQLVVEQALAKHEEDREARLGHQRAPRKVREDRYLIGGEVGETTQDGHSINPSPAVSPQLPSDQTSPAPAGDVKAPDSKSLSNSIQSASPNVPPSRHHSSTAFDPLAHALAQEIPIVNPITVPRNATTQKYILAFFLDTLPRQLYLYLLLRLPYLYFSRVTRIFEEAEMSMPMIKQGILEAARARAGLGAIELDYDDSLNAPTELDAKLVASELKEDLEMGRGRGKARHPRPPWAFELEPPPESVAYANLQKTWHSFIDSLLKEWKTLNIISVLLLSAILTILQIESAASDPVTRYSALLSMICALMSLLYGCIFIIRFGTMRKTYKGAEWAQEAQRSKTGIYWNIWVLLAMPATWLAWSMILYLTTIMAFVWRTSPFPSSSPNLASPTTTSSESIQVLIPRVIITAVLCLGLVYFVLIAVTLRRYGEMMDRAWQKRISNWIRDSVASGTGEGVGIGKRRADEKKRRRRSKEAHRSNGNKLRKPSGLGNGEDANVEGHKTQAVMDDTAAHPEQNETDSKKENIDRKEQINESRGSVYSSPALPSFLVPTVVSIPSGNPIPTSNSRQTGPTSLSKSPLLVSTTTQVAAELDRKNAPNAITVDSDNMAGLSAVAEFHQNKAIPDKFKEPAFDAGVLGSATPSGSPRTRQDKIEMVRLFGLSPTDPFADPLDLTNEEELRKCGLDVDKLGMKTGEWETFEKDIRDAFSSSPPHSSTSTQPEHWPIYPILERWSAYAHAHGVTGQIMLCEEFSARGPRWAVYHFSHHGILPVSAGSRGEGEQKRLEGRYGPIPEGLQRLDILCFDGVDPNRQANMNPTNEVDETRTQLLSNIRRISLFSGLGQVTEDSKLAGSKDISVKMEEYEARDGHEGGQHEGEDLEGSSRRDKISL